MNLSQRFIERPVMTTVVTLALVVAGWLAYLQLPVNDLPNVDFPTITVTASQPGANPDNMASAVATPLERQFSTIEGLEEMSSTSQTGSTRITLQFSLERDIDAAAQDVQAAISQATRRLPAGMDPPQMRKVNPSESPILFLALTASTIPMQELDELGDTHIAQRLSTVPGVAQVLVFGSQKYAVRLYLDPHALAQRSLSLDQVATAIGNANSNLPSGTLSGSGRAYTVKANGQLSTAEDFAGLIIAYQDGAPVRLSDVGRAETSVENNRQATWFNGERAIVLAVQRQPGANTVEVAEAIRSLLPEVQAQLPADVQLRVLNDRSEFVKASIDEVKSHLVLAIALVVLVILLFLRNTSATVITALILPTSLLGTFAVMQALGFSLNNISLMALTLAVGFVVDDAIVVLENIMRHVEMGKTRLQAALDGTREVGFTIVSMTLSLAAVFIPILFMGGIVGRLFTEFAVTVAVAVLISGFVSLSLTPMLSSRYLSTRPARGRLFEGFERGFAATTRFYGDTLDWALHHRRMVLGGAVGLFVVTVLLFLLVPKGFIPRQDTGQLTGSTRAPEGIAYADLVARQQQVAEIIRRNPNVMAVMSSAGQAGGGDTGSNVGRVIIRLKPLGERKDTADEVIQQLRRATRAVEGMQLILQNPPAINIGAMRSSAEYQLVLQGSDLPTLYAAAEDMEGRLRVLPLLRDVNSNLELRNPEIRVDILRDRAASLGVTPQQVESTLYNAYGGRRITTIYGDSDQYSVLMELDAGFQKDIDSLNALSVQSRSGVLVPLASVARLESGVGPVSIGHYGQLPAVTLSYNLAAGVSVGEATAQVQALAREIIPPGVSTQATGSAKTFQQSMQSLPLLLAVTILAIYVILAILYEHFWHPVTILTSLPLAGFGAVLMLILFHQELNIFSFVGLILLIGIVKKNGIMMVDFAQSRQAEGLPALEAMREACLVRFRPIMMTTAAAIISALPIALGFGAGADARRGLGIAIVGGLVFSQLLTLYVTPAFYVSLERLTNRRERERQQDLAPAPGLREGA